MSLRLKTSIEAIVGAALTIALGALMLALFPTLAEAQTKAQADARSTSTIVVRPGDCLWSITSERLGPNASPQQIATGVEQLYALNKNRIGADPNLIFPGQVLSLPPRVEPSRIEAPSRVTPTRDATQPVAASPTAGGGKGESERISGTAVGEVDSKVRQAPEPVAAKPVALPNMPIKQVVPKVDSPSQTQSPSLVESFGRTARSLLSSAISAVVGLFPHNEDLLARRLLGLQIIVLTLLVALLLMWKLPMKRGTRWDDDVWGIGSGDNDLIPNRIAPFAYHPGSLGESAKGDAQRPGGTPESLPRTSEWKPSVNLRGSLLNMPLQWERALPPEKLEAIRHHVEMALEELAWLEQHRELSDMERHLQGALENLYMELSAMDRAHG